MSKMSTAKRVAHIIVGAALTLGTGTITGTIDVTGGQGGHHQQHTFVDVSSNNRPGDLTAYAKAGHVDIAVKANEGTGYVWSGGTAVADQAHSLHLLVRHYDFVRPDYADPVAECHTFVSAVKPHWKNGDTAVEDLETAGNRSDAYLANWNTKWLQCVRATFGQAVEVYTGPWFVNPRPQLTKSLCGVDIWLAAYQSHEPDVPCFRVVAWQFTDRGRVDGYPDPLDVSVDLTYFTGGDATAPDAGQGTQTSQRQPSSPTHPSNVKRNPYPRPRSKVATCAGHASGKPVQWTQYVLGRKPTGRLGAGLCTAVKRQQAGWHQKATGTVDKVFVKAAIARGRG